MAEELNESLVKWVKFTQSQRFGEQLELLKRKKSDSHIKQLNLVIVNEVIRYQGRISNSETSIETQQPILLPKNHQLTNLIVMGIHEQLCHQGVRYMLSTLRKSYWLPSGRQQIRFLLKRCRICKLWEGKSFSNPPPAPLPALRVTKNPAFTHTGCDFAGPLYVFTNEELKKAYVCLFICAVTRAVHLKVVEDLTTSSFLMALRRFISRRGIPSEIVSDNAKTFKLAKTTLERLWLNTVTAEDTVKYISSKEIKWKFNVERAPWWGGFFERMVGLTKRSLIKAVERTKMSLSEVNTVLAEIEAILNTRPLTYVYDELDEGQALSPTNFLSEAKFFALPTAQVDKDPDYLDENITSKSLMKKLRHRQSLLDRFWKIWHQDYLTNLREYHQTAKFSKKKSTFTVRWRNCSRQRRRCQTSDVETWSY